MNADAWKKSLLLHLPYGVIGLAAAKLSEAWRLSAGTDFSAKFLHLRDGVAMAFRNGMSGFVPLDLLIGFLCGCALCLLVHAKRRNAKKYRHGEEYGAARWGKPSDIAPFMDADPWNNIILTQTERLTMSSRPANPKNARNKNVLVIGGSGSGKTRFFIKPNIMQCTKTKGCSLVITDPKGTLITECGKMLAAAGYDVRVFNVISFKKSMHYNPFAYIRSEKDILKLVTALIANTKGEGKGGDDFWVKAETLLYMALIGYIHYELPPAAQNFTTLIDMLNSMEVREEDEEYRNPVDLMFEKLKAEKPEHFAVRQYAKYRMAAGKTAKSILVSCGARLAVFDIQELREITAYDELHLDTLGDKRTALFLIMSDTDASFNFLISLENRNLSHLPVVSMSHHTMGMYALYMATHGNMEGIFHGNPYAAPLKDPTLYDIPDETLASSPTFAALMAEAEKYIGYPYVWGGASPETSFDCSGFVSYVFTNSGVYNTGRLGAKGLRSLCRNVPAAQAEPGDVVFFEGTMGDGVDGITHCGIYVGNGMMIHSGSPIGYANLNDAYWKSHFHSFGRMPGL